MFEKKVQIVLFSIISLCQLSLHIISNEEAVDLNETDVPVDLHPLAPEWEMHQHLPKDTEPIAHHTQTDEIDVRRLTPSDIEQLDFEINTWTPQQLSQLSPEQTTVINAGTLSGLSREQFLSLPVSDINPVELSQAFRFESHIGDLPDSFVQQLTQEQAQAILKEQNNNLATYFRPSQIEEITKIATKSTNIEPVFHARQEDHPIHLSQADLQHQTTPQEIDQSEFDIVHQQDVPTSNSIPTNKPSWWRKLSSTLSSIADGLLKQFSSKSAISIASDAMKLSAHGIWVPANDQAVDNAFRKLTTKQKDSVANDWLVETNALFAARTHELEKEIFHLSQTKAIPEDVRQEQIASLKQQIQENHAALKNRINFFTYQMQRYLSPDEQLVALQSPNGTIRLECIDMSEINPTKSIESQKQQLKDNGIINTYDVDWWNNTTATIHSKTLETFYAHWITVDIIQDFDREKPLYDQIQQAALKLTKHQWQDFDPTLQQAILDRVNAYFGTDIQIEDFTPITQPLLSQNHQLIELQYFARQTSNQANTLATRVAENRYEQKNKQEPQRNAMYTKDESIEIYKKLFLQAYKNLYTTLQDEPQLQHLSGRDYGNAVANILATISAKMPVITDIPKDSQTVIVKKYIAARGI